MNSQRHQALLSGQTTIAQKVYQFITSDPNKASTVFEIAAAMKAATGAGADIHIMRGCLSALVKSGLAREVVPGSYRQIAAKEKCEMAVAKPKEEAPTLSVAVGAKKSAEPMDSLAAISARLRTKAKELTSLADELDAQAIAVEERRDADRAETAKVRQLMALMKELG